MVSELSKRLFSVGLLVGMFGLGLTSGCETNDPCILRQAACVDVSLIGKKTDATGAPIEYHDLSVKVCSGPSVASAPCSEGMAPPSCGSELASTMSPQTLTAVASYSANVQGLVSFQLPSSCNSEVDDPPTEVDSLDAAARKARLLMLRDRDPRAVRIFVTQPQSSGPITVWDSRCEEDLFSADEWSKLKYYRVGKNEYRSVFAPLRKAQTQTP